MSDKKYVGLDALKSFLDNLKNTFSFKSHEHNASEITSGILPMARGGTGKSSLSELATAMGTTQIKIGSYTGTGQYGSSNKNSVTLGFTPKVFILYQNPCAISDSSALVSSIFWMTGMSSLTPRQGYPLTISTTSTGITWYMSGSSTTNAAGIQFNASSTTYYYIALG